MTNLIKTDPVMFECFTSEEVKFINKKIKENNIDKQDPSNAATGVSKKGEFFIVPCLPVLELLHPWLYQCQIINKEIFGYDIDWHFHLDRMNYNVYGTDGEYDWHIDANNTPVWDVKLTCLLNLSEESYEGGEFYMINFNEEKKFPSGMGIIFTSLLAHKVTPVTKGERISLTYWATGPAWK